MDPEALYKSDELDWLKKPDSLVERQFVERKKSFNENEIAEAVSAFANAPTRGGLIIVGAESDGRLAGIEASEAESPKIHRVLDRLEHQPTYLSRMVAIPGKDTVLFFMRVEHSPNRVIGLKGGRVFRRVASINKRLTPDQVTELRYARGEKQFMLERAAPFDRALLDEDLCADFQRALDHQAADSKAQSLELDLQSAHMVAPDQQGLHLTNCGLLLVARKPEEILPGAIVRVLQFEGTDESAVVKQDREFRGPLPRLVPEVLQFMTPLVRVFDFRVPGGTFKKLPEYPQAAWEEGIVNAIVHRSYSDKHRQIEIKLFNDRLVISSPGPLFGLLTIDRLASGDPPVASTPRNRPLMDVLRFWGQHVRLRGEGSRRIREEMKDRGLPPPEWNEPAGERVELTLRNDYEQILKLVVGGAPVDWEALSRKLGDKEFAIYRSRARAEWTRHASTGHEPTAKAIGTAVGLIFDPEIPGPERDELTELLQMLEPALYRGQLVDRLGDLIGKLLAGEVAMVRLGDMLSRFDEAVGRVLQFLESDLHFPAPEAKERILDWCFELLVRRVQRDPEPSRDLLARMAGAATRWRGVGRAKHLYAMITGNTLLD